MILSTTSSLDGKTIKEYRGIVFGEVISGIDFVKDFTNIRYDKYVDDNYSLQKKLKKQ